MDSNHRLLRIFVGEFHKVHGQPVYEVILIEAKRRGLAGAIVLRGIMGYGASSVMHRAQLLELSAAMPMIIEIVDETEKINHFSEYVRDLFEANNCTGLITRQEIEVVAYRHDT